MGDTELERRHASWVSCVGKHTFLKCGCVFPTLCSDCWENGLKMFWLLPDCWDTWWRQELLHTNRAFKGCLYYSCVYQLLLCDSRYLTRRVIPDLKINESLRLWKASKIVWQITRCCCAYILMIECSLFIHVSVNCLRCASCHNIEDLFLCFWGSVKVEGMKGCTQLAFIWSVIYKLKNEAKFPEGFCGRLAVWEQ